MYWFRSVFLYIAIMLFGGTMIAQQQSSDEEKAFALRIYQAQEKGDAETFYQAEQAFMEYLEKKNDWGKYYNTWMNRVVFDVNNRHFYKAFVEIRKITDDIKERHKEKYLYVPYQALGLYYVTRGNAELAEQQFLKALELTDTVNNQLAKTNLYISLAQSASMINPSRAMAYLDSLPQIRQNPMIESALLGYRCIISHKLKAQKDFLAYYAKYDSLRSNFPDQFNAMDYQEVMVYYHIYQKNYDQALAWCDSIDIEIDACELREEVYSKMGQWEKAYRADAKNDSLRDVQLNEVLSSDLSLLSRDLASMDYALKKVKARKKQLITLGLMAMAIIALLVVMLLYRQRINRNLQQRYDELLEARQNTEAVLAVRQAFVSTLQNRLDSPISLLLGVARAFNNPDFHLETTEGSEIYTSIIRSSESIENLLELILDSYVHDYQRITNEQKQACLDTLSSPLNGLIGMAQMLHDDKDHQLSEAEYRQLWSEISSNAYEVASDIHEFILFCKIGENETLSKEDKVSLNDIAMSALSGFDLRNHHLEKCYSTEVGSNVTIVTNHIVMQDILTSLISNADKYASGESIQMNCYEEAGGTYAISIANEGSPIAPEMAKIIFEPFVTLSGNKHSLGLGLPMAHKAAKLLGYRLGLDTDYTQGVRFVLNGIC